VNIINTAIEQKISLNFCSGYRQVYPDKMPFVDEKALLIELLGPSNQLIEGLFETNRLNTNHYSIVARLTLGAFRMIIAADAQMENWFHYDRERMLVGVCTVLRTAHHGSANGTQYEGIQRLDPGLIVVSSEPWGKDNLPDLIGCAAFTRFRKAHKRSIVSLTEQTGTIYIKVRPTGGRDYFFLGEGKRDHINLGAAQPLKRGTDPTDWAQLLTDKMVAEG
jgi:hypothetical protein